MADDLVKRLRDYAEGFKHTARMEGRAFSAVGDLLEEAAARLSPPEGDKVEAVARALCEAEGNDPDAETWHRNGDVQEPYGPKWLHYRGLACAALAALPTATAGEVMREAAAACAGAWKRADALRLAAGEMTAQEMRTAQAVAAGIERAILALPLPEAPR